MAPGKRAKAEWVLGFAGVLALLGQTSCVNDEGPAPFTTAGTCYRGDLEGCVCTAKGREGDPGLRTCADDGRFTAECRCAGCTLSPDCSGCGEDCRERCFCETSGDEAACRVRCGPDGGAASTATFARSGTR